MAVTSSLYRLDSHSMIVLEKYFLHQNNIPGTADSRVRSACCSCSRSRFSSQDPQESLQMSLTSDLGNLVPSSVGTKHTQSTQIYIQATHLYTWY